MERPQGLAIAVTPDHPRGLEGQAEGMTLLPSPMRAGTGWDWGCPGALRWEGLGEEVPWPLSLFPPPISCCYPPPPTQ